MCWNFNAYERWIYVSVLLFTRGNVWDNFGKFRSSKSPLQSLVPTLRLSRDFPPDPTHPIDPTSGHKLETNNYSVGQVGIGPDVLGFHESVRVRKENFYQVWRSSGQKFWPDPTSGRKCESKSEWWVIEIGPNAIESNHSGRVKSEIKEKVI